MRKIITLILSIIVLTAGNVFSQTTTPPANAAAPVVYPKIVGYLSFILPLVTINKNETTNDFSDFKNGFAIGFPVGINVLYGAKFGFSYEITPTVESEDGVTKTSKILFDPVQCLDLNMVLLLYRALLLKLQGAMVLHPFLMKLLNALKRPTILRRYHSLPGLAIVNCQQ